MPASYIRVLLRSFADNDERSETLLEQTGMRASQLPEPSAHIELWQFLQLTDNLTSWHPDWAVETNLVSYASAHGPLGLACLSSPTLDGSLDILARFAHLRAPYFRLARTRDDNFCILRVEPEVELVSEARRPLLVSLLLSIQGVVESALQRPMKGGRFDIAGPRTSGASGYHSSFNAPVCFDAPATAVYVPHEWTSLECPVSNPHQYYVAMAELEAMERDFSRDHGLVREVERALRKSDEPPSLQQVAKSLNMARRTLERRLSEAGTSFRALVQDDRRWRAEVLLHDLSLTTTDIAYRLGYADPANFARACHRWFGMSPQDYRARVLGREEGKEG